MIHFLSQFSIENHTRPVCQSFVLSTFYIKLQPLNESSTVNIISITIG